MEKVAEDDYRASAKSIELLGNTIAAATTGTVLEEVGGELETALFGPEASLNAQQQAPANAVPCSSCRLTAHAIAPMKRIGDGPAARANLQRPAHCPPTNWIRKS